MGKFEATLKIYVVEYETLDRYYPEVGSYCFVGLFENYDEANNWFLNKSKELTTFEYDLHEVEDKENIDEILEMKGFLSLEDMYIKCGDDFICLY